MGRETHTLSYVLSIVPDGVTKDGIALPVTVILNVLSRMFP